MIVSDIHKYVFLAIPKTGTRSTYNVLTHQLDGVARRDHEKIIPEEYRSYYTFTTIRNPYDRAVSMWWSTCKRGKDRYGFIETFKNKGIGNTFSNFLKILDTSTLVTCKQVDYVNNKIDKLLRFERLEDDINDLPFVKSNIKLPRINTTIDNRPTWKTICTQQDIERINHLYSEDIEYLSDYYEKL